MPQLVMASKDHELAGWATATATATLATPGAPPTLGSTAREAKLLAMLEEKHRFEGVIAKDVLAAATAYSALVATCNAQRMQITDLVAQLSACRAELELSPARVQSWAQPRAPLEPQAQAHLSHSRAAPAPHERSLPLPPQYCAAPQRAVAGTKKQATASRSGWYFEVLDDDGSALWVALPRGAARRLETAVHNFRQSVHCPHLAAEALGLLSDAPILRFGPKAGTGLEPRTARLCCMSRDTRGALPG